MLGSAGGHFPRMESARGLRTLHNNTHLPDPLAWLFKANFNLMVVPVTDPSSCLTHACRAERVQGEDDAGPAPAAGVCPNSALRRAGSAPGLAVMRRHACAHACTHGARQRMQGRMVHELCVGWHEHQHMLLTPASAWRMVAFIWGSCGACMKHSENEDEEYGYCACAL